MKTTAIILAALALTGCAAPQMAPSVDPLSLPREQFGEKPAEEDVKQFIANMMKDPDSVKYRGTTKSIPCYMRHVPITGGQIAQYGWCNIFEVSGKNSYGAYVGYKEVRVFTRNGNMTRYVANPWFKEFWLH